MQPWTLYTVIFPSKIALPRSGEARGAARKSHFLKPVEQHKKIIFFLFRLACCVTYPEPCTGTH